MLKRFLSIVALALVAGCGIIKPPKPPDTTYGTTVRVRDSVANVTLGGIAVTVGEVTKRTDDLGGARFDGLQFGGMEACASSAAYLDKCEPIVRGEVETNIGLTPRPPPDIPVEPLQRLHASGPIFRTADNAPFRWMFESQFTAMRRFEQGEDLAPLVKASKDRGANGWRVFLQHYYMDWPAITPYKAALDRIRPFADYLARRGLRVELVVLADCQKEAFNMDDTAQRDRVRAVVEAIATATNVTIEVANEPKDNGVDVWKVIDGLGYQDAARRPVLMASGDYHIVGNEKDFRVLDYLTDHPDRDPDWPAEGVKTGHFIYGGWGPDAHSPGFAGRKVPIVEDEPHKAGEVPNDGNDTADDNPLNFEDGFGGFMLGGAGGTLHSVDGIRSRPLGPKQEEAARRAFAAMRLIPAEAATGEYTHDGLASHPLEDTREASEVAGRIFNGKVYLVAAQPTAAWRAVPRNGYTCRPLNERGNIIECSK